MASLTDLINKPLEAASAVLQTAAAAAAGPAAVAASAATPQMQGNATFTDDALRMLLYNLFHGDSRLQAQVCQQYYAPDVTFSLNEGLLALHGQEQLQQLLRGLQLFMRFKPEVLEISSSADKAIILLNLNISYKALPLTWWFPVKAPTTITLSFNTPTDNTGVMAAVTNDSVITHHHQEMSLADLMVWNPGWEWFNARFWGPVSGKALSTFAQWEIPLVENYASYIAGGGGHVQAILWTFEDQLKLFGLKGLPSNLVPYNAQRNVAQYGQAPAAAAVPPPSPPAAAAAAVPAAAAAGPVEVTETVIVSQGPEAEAAAAEAAAAATPAATAPAAAAPEDESSQQHWQQHWQHQNDDAAAAAAAGDEVVDVPAAAAPAGYGSDNVTTFERGTKQLSELEARELAATVGPRTLVQ